GAAIGHRCARDGQAIRGNRRDSVVGHAVDGAVLQNQRAAVLVVDAITPALAVDGDPAQDDVVRWGVNNDPIAADYGDSRIRPRDRTHSDRPVDREGAVAAGVDGQDFAAGIRYGDGLRKSTARRRDGTGAGVIAEDRDGRAAVLG